MFGEGVVLAIAIPAADDVPAPPYRAKSIFPRAASRLYLRRRGTAAGPESARSCAM
jgi:hypothetical protein